MNSLTSDYCASVAAEWLKAWNDHELSSILSHYAPEIEFTSPFVERILGGGNATLRGLDALREYFGRALATFPDLKFTDARVFCGAQSMVVEYRSVNNLRAAEFFAFNAAGQIARVHAHYSAPSI